jgi:cellulose synthase operon protein C
MPNNSKPLTPAELSALEHAFASDPGSGAYRPLTEAYLAAGRFMEAMVVCKKGVKAHPDDPAARVLLARVYAEQGKDRKALEELAAVLAAYPAFAAASRMAASLHYRLGERGAGEAALRKAAEAAPDDPETRELLAKHGVTPAPRAAPAAAAPPVAPRVASAQCAGGPPLAPRVAPASASRGAAAEPYAEKSEEVPLPTPVPSSRARNVAYAEQLAEKYGTQSFQIPGREVEAKKSKRGMVLTTVGLAAVLAAALGGWSWFNRARAERLEAIDKLEKEILVLYAADAYPSWVEAGKKAAQILEYDRESLRGNAYRAYAAAIRFADHGEGDAARDEAVAAVQAGAAAGRSGYLTAAQAYLALVTGDAAGAKRLAEQEDAEGKQPTLLVAVLGAIELREGNLDAARQALTAAQKAEPGDARTAWLLAESYRRRGEGYEGQASGWYDWALRAQKSHVPSLLGKSLVLLSRGQTEEAGRAAQAVLAPEVAASKPQLALAHAIRGGVLAADGKAAEAAAEEQEAAKLDPVNPDLPWLAGHRKLRAGDAAGAVEAFQRAVALDSKRVSLYADLVRALLQKEGGTQQAIDTLRKAVSRLGESPRLALLLGDAYRAQGDADLARGQYEKAIQLGKTFPDARLALARLFRAQSNVPGALVELEAAIAEYGTGASGGAAMAYVEKAEVKRARNDKREEIVDAYTKALELDPYSCDALWGLGKLEWDAAKGAGRGGELLARYARDCPRAAHASEAARLAGGK